MKIEKNNQKIKYLYHYTNKENVEKILSSRKITSKDKYMFFTDGYYKSIQLFEDEMMSNKYYYDLDKKLRRRSYANPEDYKILKIPYQNDGKFVKIHFHKNNRNSIYNRSIIHEGELYFDPTKVEVLDVPVSKGHIWNFGFLLKLAFLFNMFIMPIKAKADTWLDREEYYDISWYSEDKSSYLLSTAEQFAGLSYLSNIRGYTFEGKKISFTFGNCYLGYDCKLDMSAHDWVPLRENFAGTLEVRHKNGWELCGVHRLFFGYDDEIIPFKENNTNCTYYDPNYESDVLRTASCSPFIRNEKAHYITVNDYQNGTVTLNRTRGISDSYISAKVVADTGYYLESFTAKNSSGTNLTWTKSGLYYSYNMENSDITIDVSFKKRIYTITINNPSDTSVTPEGPINVEYLGNQTFEVNTTVDYEFVGYMMNGGELIPVNSNQFTISNVQNNITIDIVVEPTKYTIENVKEDIYEFEIDKKFTDILEVKLCDKEDNCEILEKADCTVHGQIIRLEKELEEGDYQLIITFANEEQASSTFTVVHKTEEKPAIIENPKTKTNLLVLLVTSIFLAIMSVFIKKKREDLS